MRFKFFLVLVLLSQAATICRLEDDLDTSDAVYFPQIVDANELVTYGNKVAILAPPIRSVAQGSSTEPPSSRLKYLTETFYSTQPETSTSRIRGQDHQQSSLSGSEALLAAQGDNSVEKQVFSLPVRSGRTRQFQEAKIPALDELPYVEPVFFHESVYQQKPAAKASPTEKPKKTIIRKRPIKKYLKKPQSVSRKPLDHVASGNEPKLQESLKIQPVVKQQKQLVFQVPRKEFKLPDFRLSQSSERVESFKQLPLSPTLLKEGSTGLVTKGYFEDSDEIPGDPGRDYPAYNTVPNTNFKCGDQKYPGFYADVAARCQAFHICQSDGRADGFLCPNGTVFNQQYFICDWWYNVECSQSESFYSLNAVLYDESAYFGQV